MVGFVFRVGFPVLLLPLGMLNRIFASWYAEQDLLDFFPTAGLPSAAREPSPLGLSGTSACLSLSQAGKPASRQGLTTSAFEPRNFFLATGDAEPDLIPAAPGAARGHRFFLLRPTEQARLLN